MSSADSTIFWLSLYYYYLIILKSLLFLISIIFQNIICISCEGKVKEKSFDALTNSTMLKSDWISQSSATQVSAIFLIDC